MLQGHRTMAAGLTGDQWNEGDVSDSVVRRVVLPDAFFAIDGLFETLLTVLAEFGAYPAVIDREFERYLPFLATTRLLVAAVRAGVGRETAHERIKEHAVESARAMRAGEIEAGDLFDRVANDPDLPIDPDVIAAIRAERAAFTGRAADQAAAFAGRVGELVERHPDAAAYVPEEIL
jgi:adenylosuccinate lyase